MYESPVKISFDEAISKASQELDNQIIATIHQYVSVDKNELIRALQYDRGQYEKGYEDGKRDTEIALQTLISAGELWTGAGIHGFEIGFRTLNHDIFCALKRAFIGQMDGKESGE